MRVLVQRGCGEAGKRISLDESEEHHLKVRRAKNRDLVEILDGAGMRGTGRLLQDGRHWLVEVETAERESRPPEMTLAVAAGDRDRFFWMAEKSVELGVTRIVPLKTVRGAGVATGFREAHLDRLRRHALEATKQCGVAWAVQVDKPRSLEEFLESSPAGAGWLADRSGSPPPTELGESALTAVIGPEGGLLDTERSRLVAAGYVPTVLSPYTLRFETAALAAAALATVARMRGSHG